MRPDFVVMLDFTGFDDIDEKTAWCNEFVGKPYTVIDHPYKGVPIGIHYESDDGTWCVYINNEYVYGPQQPVNTWCFLHSIDANAFKLRWP